MKLNKQPDGRPQPPLDQLASDDAILQQPPNNAGSTAADPDHERPGGMSGGLGKKDPAAPDAKSTARHGTIGENRAKDYTTSPPSTPQGPASNDLLVAPEYRDGPYPGDIPDKPAGEGSTVATHSTGLTAEGKQAAREGRGPEKPLLDPAGEDKNKKEGREKHEP